MHRRIAAAIIVALMGLSCHSVAPVQDSAAPVQNSDKDRWIHAGVFKVERYSPGLWQVSYQVISGTTRHVVDVAEPMSLSDAIALERLLGNRRLIHIFEGEMSKETEITGWKW